MADFSFVTARLATGAALAGPEDVAALVAAGVTHVIDCRAEFDDAPLFAAAPELSYLWDGTDDDGQPKPPAWFSKGIVFALDALSHRHHKVLCHCAAGVNRGPSMAAAVMMASGWTKDQAEQQIRAARPQVGLAYLADAAGSVAALGYG
jgi:hypothetical protein